MTMISLLAVQAHLDMGSEVVKDGIVIDFGYSPRIPYTGELTILSFLLFEDGTDRKISYSSADFKISLDDTVVFDENIEAEDNHVFIEHIFKESGVMYIEIVFWNNDERLVDAEFAVAIASQSRKFNPKTAIITSIFVVLLLVVISYLTNKKQWGD